MASKVNINGLDGLPISKPPIDPGKPFVIQYEHGEYNIVAVCQVDTTVYRLVSIQEDHKKFWLNRTHDADINLYDAVQNGTLREYLETLLGYKVIDCDINVTIVIS